MIGHLKGTVLSVSAETAIIDVHGVGYEVNGTARMLDRLQPGEAASLSIDTVVREDFIRLYGFANEAERHCFRLLQTVSGVGAKAALAILQVLDPAGLLDAISVGDDAAIARAQGVGKKIATRIVTELSGKAPDLMAVVTGNAGLARTLAGKGGKAPADAANPAMPAAPTGAKADAISALVNLGYDPTVARQAVTRAAADNPQADVQALIKAALKELASA